MVNKSLEKRGAKLTISIRVRASRKERQGNRALRDLDVSDRGSLGFKGDCRYWEDLLRIGD